MVALATAFIRVRADTSAVKGDVGKTSATFAEAGKKSGKEFADGFYRDAQGRIRAANGRFATDAEKAAIGAGTKSGAAFGKNFGKQFRSHLKDLAGFAGIAGVGLVVKQIASIGMAYEDNLNIFKAVTNATGAQMDQVAEKARQLGADVKLPGVSAAGAAAAMTELSKAGFSVEQAMDAAQGTLQLARAAGIDEARAATIAASAINTFKISASDANYVVDQLAATANSSSVEITDVADAFKMAASVYSSFQGPVVGSKEAITELNTAIAILGNNGIRGSDAGTSLKQMLLQLTGPSMQAKGIMKELAIEAGGVNVSFEQQQKILHGSAKERESTINQLSELNPSMAKMGDIAFDANGKMRSLPQILDLVARGTKNLTQEERLYAITQIFGADASRAVVTLLKGGLPVYEAQRKAVLRQGAAADVAASKNAGLKGALDNVKSQFENMAISIYNAVKGPLTTSLNNFAAFLPRAFDFLNENKAVILGLVYAFGLWTAAVKLQTFWNGVLAAGGFLKWLKAFVIGTKAATAAQLLLDGALAANPIGIVVLAIGALVAAIVVAWKNSETFRRVVLGAWAGIQTGVAAVVNWFKTSVWPVIQQVWNAISTGARFVWEKGIRPAFNAIVTYYKTIVFPIFFFLLDNVIKPVFGAIATVIGIWWSGVKLVFNGWKLIFENVIFPVVRAFYNNVAKPIFGLVGRVVQAMWIVVQIIFKAFVNYLQNVVFPVVRFLYNNVVKPIFSGIGLVISGWWAQVKIVFSAVRAGFATLGNALRIVYNTVIRPMLVAFGNFLNTYVRPAFDKGVSAIGRAWDRVKEIARKPVAFVVNQVINPLIGGFNNIAGAVGIKDRVSPIKGFAKGGRIPGRASSEDNLLATMTDRSGRGISKLKVATGEFIVNAKSTAQWLPLLNYINGQGKKINGVDPSKDGMTGYADGGIVGFFKKIKSGLSGAASAITDPVGSLRKIYNNVIGRIPGAGMLVNSLKGMGKTVLEGIISKLKTAFLGPANFGAWPSSPAAQRGDSGVWRKVVALIKSTGPLSGSFGNAYRPGDPLWHGSGRAVDWMGYNQDALASFLAARRPLELIHRTNKRDYAYTRGQNMGSFDEALMNEHANHIHIAMKKGGLLTKIGNRPEVKLLDRGGEWKSGTIGVNASGHTEHVMTGGPGGDMAAMLELLSAILAVLKGLGVDVATAMQSNTLRAATTARSMGTTRRA